MHISSSPIMNTLFGKGCDSFKVTAFLFCFFPSGIYLVQFLFPAAASQPRSSYEIALTSQEWTATHSPRSNFIPCFPQFLASSHFLLSWTLPQIPQTLKDQSDLVPSFQDLRFSGTPTQPWSNVGPAAAPRFLFFLLRKAVCGLKSLFVLPSFQE